MSCLQLLLVAKPSAPRLIGNELYSSMIKNLSFTSALNLYSLKGKLGGLKSFLAHLVKSSGSLMLPLWFLTLNLNVLPWTPFAAPTLLLPYPLQPWTQFWWRNIYWYVSLQLSLTLLTLKHRILPNWLGMLTPIYILFTSSLLPCWPDKSIRMHIFNYSSLKGMDSVSFSWKNCIPLWLVPTLT